MVVRAKEVIIEREYSLQDVLVKVIVLTVDARSTSSILESLCEHVPLAEFGLLHLKRVRKNSSLPPGKVQVLLCPEHQIGLISSQDSVKKLLEDNAQTVVEVVKVAPETKKEFQEWNTHWPMNFHPGELDRQRDRGMDEEEVKHLEGFVQQLLQSDSEICKRLSKKEKCEPDATIEETNKVDVLKCLYHGGLMVNPQQQTVICTTVDAISRIEQVHPEYNFTHHPILTPTMLCIEQVAAIARGEGDSQDRLPLGHYLCTGLDLYLMGEPDLMSCMALVHSRIRRVFFIHADPEHGALLSGNGHIHSLKALNHHFRVFQLSIE